MLTEMVSTSAHCSLRWMVSVSGLIGLDIIPNCVFACSFDELLLLSLFESLDYNYTKISSAINNSSLICYILELVLSYWHENVYLRLHTGAYPVTQSESW